MKRRALIIRSVMTTASAGIFTAIGWLMGTRTLTMTQDVICEGGIVVGHTDFKCIGGNCPHWSGYCGYDCDKYWCPGNWYMWYCYEEDTARGCCTNANCAG